MTNQIRDNNESKNCFKLFSKDCYNTFYDESIMDDKEIKRDIRGNRKPFNRLSIDKRELVMDSLSDIMDYSPDFNKIGKLYLVRINKPINQNILADKIKIGFKYSYYKAQFFAVIKVFLILFQLCVSIVNVYAKNKRTDIKFKIFRHKINAILFLKLFYFSCYDSIYIIHDFYFLIKLSKKKFNKYLIIIIKHLDTFVI